MVFDPIRAETRFGCGLSPVVAPPQSIRDMIAGLRGPDVMAEQYPIVPFDRFRSRFTERNRLRRLVNGNGSLAEKQEAMAQQKALRQDTKRHALDWMRNSVQRQIHSETAFRERLAAFWGDHFTARGKQRVLDRATSPYLEEAVRPHIAGRFEDMLIAVETHPLMMHFLDQDKSVGPNSRLAKKKGKSRGLNENLAREILELHTLGVDGPYSQDDVRQLAELLTGLDWTPKKGVMFRKDIIEPGKEKVLGKSYGPGGGVNAIHEVLRDLARHPVTARHLAWKLAMHFVSDTPDPEMIKAMAAAYLETSGDLMAVYKVLLSDPRAWQATPGNLKRPLQFMTSSLRALGLSSEDLGAWPLGKIARRLVLPLRLMGQPWEEPSGPDGWAEEDAHWLTPQGMAGRMQWALGLPEALGGDVPDPREFVTAALGPDVPERIKFVAEAAESRREGVALVLMSPAFQRH